MLPHEDLKPFYEKVVWLWVCRTWREDEGDREAARIHDRFGVTSWPHLFVIDPRDDEVLVRAGRSTKEIARAFEEATGKVEPAGTEAGPLLDAMEKADVRIRELEALAAKGEKAATRKRRKQVAALLEDADAVVRIRAVRWLVEHDPKAILPHAERLLLEGNDAMRFALLDGIAEREMPELSPVLARLVDEAGRTIAAGNPNVVRGKAARCLVTSGDERAIDVLAPIAREANARNMTTHGVVEALGAIGERADREDRDRVVRILLDSWPAAVEEGGDAKSTKTLERYALRLVETVAEALARAHGRKRPPEAPSGWSKEDREAWLKAVEARFK